MTSFMTEDFLLDTEFAALDHDYQRSADFALPKAVEM